MDLPDTDSISIKTEPGTRGTDGGGLSYTDIDIDLQDIKKECLEYSQSVEQTTGPLPPGGKSFKCPHCNYSCSRHDYLKTHLRSHSGEKSFSCAIFSGSHCELSPQLRSHLPDLQTGSRAMDLPDTDSISIKTEPGTRGTDGGVLSYTDIDIDLQDVKMECLEYSQSVEQTTGSLPPGGKSFQCPHCNYSCSRPDYLKTHLRSHSGEKRFCCVVCKSLFSLKCYLKSHMVIHTGEKPFSCTICNKSFSRKPSLKVHVLTHEKRFSCTVCSFSFCRKSYLKLHMLTHIAEKPFSCTICNKSFSCKSHLKRHVVTHEKRFSCTVCSFSFSRKSYLKLHMLTHEQRFFCTVCSYTFSSKSYLNTHMLTHAGFFCTV